MHYYIVTCLEKNGPVVRLEVILVHPDIETFGTERCFAWKLLSDFVSPDDDGDDVELARKYITRVEVGPLMHGTVTSQERGWFSVKREVEAEDDEDAELPTVVYTIEVSDPSLLRPVKVGDSEESVAYVETDKMIFDEPAAASDWRRFECTEGASSKFWEARLHGSMLHVRWGKLKDRRPGAFVELALGHPDILIGSGDGEDCVVLALQALSRTEPSSAVDLALDVAGLFGRRRLHWSGGCARTI